MVGKVHLSSDIVKSFDSEDSLVGKSETGHKAAKDPWPYKFYTPVLRRRHFGLKPPIKWRGSTGADKIEAKMKTIWKVNPDVTREVVQRVVRSCNHC